MKRPIPSPEELDRRLRRAHRSRPDLVLPPGWQANLMREINGLSRQSTVEARREESVAGFSRLLFRFAGAGAVLAVGLLLYAQLYAPDLEAHAAGMVMEQPAVPVSLEEIIWS